MNDSDLETHLRALRPTPPAPALEQRIARALAEAPPTSAPAAGVLRRPASVGRVGHWLRDLGWAAAGAAAAFAVLALLSPRARPLAQLLTTPEPSAETAAVNTFEHAAATEELIATQDSAEVIETEDGLVRPVRYSYRERHAWANPRTGARMEIEVPREDVYLVPVSLQ